MLLLFVVVVEVVLVVAKSDAGVAVAQSPTPSMLPMNPYSKPAVSEPNPKPAPRLVRTALDEVGSTISSCKANISEYIPFRSIRKLYLSVVGSDPEFPDYWYARWKTLFTRLVSYITTITTMTNIFTCIIP